MFARQDICGFLGWKMDQLPYYVFMKVSVKIHKDRLHDLYPKDRLHDLFPKDRLHDLYPKDRLHDLSPESVPLGCPVPGISCCDLPTRGQISESRVKLDPGTDLNTFKTHGASMSQAPGLDAVTFSFQPLFRRLAFVRVKLALQNALLRDLLSSAQRGGTGREISPSPHLSTEEYSWRGNGSRGGRK